MFLAKGYNVVVRSYENDGDYENTQVKHCETRHEANFWVELALLFTSKHGYTDKGKKFGNAFLTEEEHNQVLAEWAAIVRKYNYQYPLHFNMDDEALKDFDTLSDAVCDIVGFSHDGDTYRAADRIEILYLPCEPEIVERYV